MSLPKNIPGAHEKIRCFDNLGKLGLEKKVAEIIGGDSGALVELQQINHHLAQAFEYADLILARLKDASPKLAQEWQKVFTGHNISYPLLSGSSE